MFSERGVIMEAVRQYVISISAAAVFCGVINAILMKTGSHKLIKLLCGAFLAVALLNPVRKFSLDDLEEYLRNDISFDTAAVDKGSEIAREAMARMVAENTEAYILDCAGSYGADLSVTVCVSEDPVPVPEAVTICGAVSPYIKTLLQRAIRDDLGISPEDQTWTG